MNIIGIIPARYASTRFPAKLLQKIGTKSIIQMVYEQCLKTKSLDKVVVATDNDLIFDHISAFGGEVVMTSDKHQSGTDRCAEALKYYGGSMQYDFAVNIQGDEPLISPDSIDELCAKLNNSTQVASVCKKIESIETLMNPNVVKVVLGERNQALYFSRSLIPHLRDVPFDNWLTQTDFYKHIGIYAFNTEILNKIVHLPQSNLEKIEKLEQLRWLANGFKISMVMTKHDSIGIDTEEDLMALKQFLERN